MADEIAQVIGIEIEGVKVLIKGSMQMAAWLAQALKSILGFGKDKIDNRSGERSIQAIFKLSGGEPPAKLDVPEKYQDEFFALVKEKGLHYAKAVDFDLTDGLIPILVPSKDFSAFVAIKESFIKKKIEEDQKALKDIFDNIAETKERLLTADKDNVALLEIKLENLDQAKNELEVILDQTKQEYEEKNYEMSVVEYLSTAKGTEFEKDPDKAIAEYEKGVVMAKQVSAKSCMQPVRSQSLMPVSGTQYYMPDNGIIIERNYHVDDDIVYSDYRLKTEQGVIHEFSDKGITKESWNEEVLPKFFDAAGIAENIKCKIFQTIEQVKAYIQHFNKVTPKSEQENMGFSNAEVLSEMEIAIEDSLKGMASANAMEQKISFQVPQEKLFVQDGKVIYAPEGIEGIIYQFQEIDPGECKDGMISFKAESNSSVLVKEKGATEQSITASDVKDIIAAKRDQIVERIRNAAEGR